MAFSCVRRREKREAKMKFRASIFVTDCLLCGPAAKAVWRNEIGGAVVGLETLSGRVEKPSRKFVKRVDDSNGSGYD